MAFVSITATIHLGPLDANADIFTAAVPAEHPGRLIYAEIDEAFDIGSPTTCRRGRLTRLSNLETTGLITRHGGCSPITC